MTALAEPVDMRGDVLAAYQRCRWGELALLRHGFAGDRLEKLARTVARDYCNRTGAVLGDRLEDLVSVLTEAGLKAALRFDPERPGADYSFASYLYDKMELAIEPDFFRRKREGFGDRRYGNDGRIVLGETLEDEPDLEFDFERVISDKRLVRYQHAAEAVGMTKEEWIVVTLDRAARQIERTAA